jgi:membrane protein
MSVKGFALMTWRLLKSAAEGYMADNALSRGAAVAYYTVFSLAPVLLIVVAIAGLAFGEDAARGAIVDQIGGLTGKQGAEAIQTMLHSASDKQSGYFATGVGIITLLLTASGVFSELQAALNDIWKAEPKGSTVSRLIRVRIASLGLVMALGFLLLVSLAVSAALSAIGTWLRDLLPGLQILMRLVSFVVSLVLIAALFAAIYKVLPDRDIAWRDVAVGAIATALLFDIGKVLISMYIGTSSVASTYGAAGTLAVLLLWIYYSSQIFLFGAEFTRAYAETHGSFAGRSITGRTPKAAAKVVPGGGTASQEAGPAGELEHLQRQLRAARR